MRIVDRRPKADTVRIRCACGGVFDVLADALQAECPECGRRRRLAAVRSLSMRYHPDRKRER